MKVPTPDGVYLQRLVTARDLQRYGVSSERERLEVRAYLRYAVRESTPGSARAMMSVVASFFGIGVSFLVVLVGLNEDDPQALIDSLVGLGVVALLLLLLGGFTLVSAWREDRRNAIATSWLAEIEAAETRLAIPDAGATALPDSPPSAEMPRRGRRSRRVSVPARRPA